MGMYPESFIEQVRDTASLVGIIGEYVRLKKSGKDWAGLCPFHNEKTPSFRVNEEKQIFKCFGCGAGGDIFKFLMLVEQLSFPEAIERLAERTAIPLPERTSADLSGPKIDRDRLRAIMEQASQFYQQQLEASEDARKYLEERGVTTETICQIGLGYAPPGGVLTKYLTSKGFKPLELESVGLAKSISEANYQDNFRHRILFPIKDLSGKVIAFGGRALGDGFPKYLNSPETALYTKSRNLFGLESSKDWIRKSGLAVLVEGYFDWLIPFQSGIHNIVASLGTSLTVQQVRLLGRYTQKVVVSYDPDSAGVSAARRSIDLFLEEGFRINILSLPGGQDPDSFIRGKGVDLYRNHLKTSVPYMDFLLQSFVREEKNPSSPKSKVNVLNKLLPYLGKVSNRVERSEYSARLAEKLQLDNALILGELKKVVLQRGAHIRLSNVAETQAIHLAERKFLKILLDVPAIAGDVLAGVDLDDFRGLATESIMRSVLEVHHQGAEVNFLNVEKKLEDEEDRRLLSEFALGASSTEWESTAEEARRCLVALRRLNLANQKRRLLALIGDAEKVQNQAEVIRLMEKKRQLDRQLLTLPDA